MSPLEISAWLQVAKLVVDLLKKLFPKKSDDDRKKSLDKAMAKLGAPKDIQDMLA